MLFIQEHSASLRGEDGKEIEVAVDELSQAAESTESNTSKLIRVSRTAQEVVASQDPWHQAILRIEAAGAGGIGDAIRAEAEWLSVRLGKSVSIRTVERQLNVFRVQGAEGLPDQRGSAFGPRRSTIDPRIVEAMNHVLSKRARASTTTQSAAIEQIMHRVRQLHGDDVRMPSRATFYRLLDSEERGRFSFGSAKTRESLALQPDREFGSRTALRPGELVEMDSTRIDVMMRFDENTVGRPELTILIDVATRSILAALLRVEGTKSVDLLVVLARALVPYSRRLEGARETRRLISTAWAEDALIDQERFDRLRRAQPFIFPETITTDRGRNYISKHFREVCEALNISLITAAPHTPTDKPHVERAFGAINSLFLQYAKGYVGRSVEHRGRDVGAQSDQLLTIAQAQELLEDWIAVEWQNRSHDGLRDPLHPRIKLSPNEMCRAFRAYVPELHVPLTRENYIALLPVRRRVINRYGVRIDHRIYNSIQLNGLWRRKSDDKGNKRKWPIRVDPYNLHVVWLEVNGEFIPLRWSNEVHELPLLGDVWRHAREDYASRDGSIDDERRQLVAAMKGFVGRGNPKSSVKSGLSNRQRARAAAVAADPMNMTSATDAEPGSDLTEDHHQATHEEPVEEWPHTGGFPFIGDSLDGVRKRVDE